MLPCIQAQQHFCAADMDSVLSTFMTTNKDSRAVLATMGCYALTAASVVAWVVYGIFQRHPKVFQAIYHRCLFIMGSPAVRPGPLCRSSTKSSFKTRWSLSLDLRLLTQFWRSSEAGGLSSPRTTLASWCPGTSTCAIPSISCPVVSQPCSPMYE